MKHIYILFLMLFSGTAFSQFGSNIKLNPDQNAAIIHFLTNRATGDAPDRGQFRTVGEVATIMQPYFGKIDTVYINAGDSLVIIMISGDSIYFEGGAGGGKSAFYKLGTTDPPTATDSIERSDYTLFNGEIGGRPTKIEITKEGYIGFNADSLYTSVRYLLKADPLQPGAGGSTFGITQLSVPNGYGIRNNETFSIGFNPLGGPGSFLFNMESHYRPDIADSYHEFHIPYTDSLGNTYRILSGTINDDLTNWNIYGTVNTFALRAREYAAGPNYFTVEQSNNENSILKLNGSLTGEGAQLRVNTINNALSIEPVNGMPFLSIDATGTRDANFNIMRIMGDWGTLHGSNGYAYTLLAKEQFYGGVVDVDQGWGWDLSNGALVIDSTQVATQDDINSIVDTNIGNTDIEFTGDRLLEGNGHDLIIDNLGYLQLEGETGISLLNGTGGIYLEGGVTTIQADNEYSFIDVAGNGLFFHNTEGNYQIQGAPPSDTTATFLGRGADGFLKLMNPTLDKSNTNEIQSVDLSIGGDIATFALSQSNSFKISHDGNLVLDEPVSNRLEIALAGNVDIDVFDDLTTATTFSGDVAGPYNDLQLGTGVVGTNEIATDGVDASEIVANAVGASELAASGVTGTSCTNCNLTYDEDGRITIAANGTGGAAPKINIGTTVDGAGDVLTTGVKGYTSIPNSGTITNITILADVSGSVQFEIKKSTFAGFPGSLTSIVGANTPSLSGAQKAQITIDGGYTTTVTAGDVIEWSIVGSPATITRAHIFVSIQP